MMSIRAMRANEANMATALLPLSPVVPAVVFEPVVELAHLPAVEVQLPVPQ